MGCWVFPVDSKSARPLLPNGLLGASNDAEVVATWFSGEFANARVGVWTGASGIVVADLDRKNSKDGFESLSDAWLDLPDTWHYTTPNGGEHWVYAAPEGIRLTGNADYRAMSGLDRRGGNSFIIVHTDDIPTSREALTPAPVWLLDEATVRDSEGFGGAVGEWLELYGAGEPGEKILAAINRIPEGDMSHSDMVADQFNMIRLGAEGAEGAAVGLQALREAWLARNPASHTTPQDEWDWKFDEALESGITKYGQEVQRISTLPAYSLDLLALVPASFGGLQGLPQPKKHYFDAIRALVRFELSDDQIAALVWSAPPTKTHARDFGVEYLFAQISEARTRAVIDAAPRENPTTETYSEAPRLPQSSLLTAAERELVALCPTFIDRYCGWVKSRTQHANMPYHRAAAVTIWSMAFGMYGFMPEDEGTMGVNFFQGILGPSGSGKTRMTKMRDTVLREIFLDDPTYDLGDDASTQALHSALLKRGNKASYFNTDEADSALSMWLDARYLVGFIGFITKVFEGWVPVQLRQGQKDEERHGALVSFNMDLVGTSDGVLEILTEKLFKTGFLARPVWWVGDPKLDTDDRFRVSRGNRERARAEYDVGARAFAVEFQQIKAMLGPRMPMIETDAAIVRLEVAKKAIHKQLENHPRWSILEPSVTRLGDSIRKLATLSALGDGRREVLLPDMLASIQQGEEWVRNVVWVSEQVAASAFSRQCDDIERYVVEQGGKVTMTKLTHSFRRLEPREFLSMKDSLIAQGRLKMDNTGTMIGLNT